MTESAYTCQFISGLDGNESIIFNVIYCRSQVRPYILKENRKQYLIKMIKFVIIFAGYVGKGSAKSDPGC